ncbi:solute carrier family 13 member 4-like [Ixodes scapularis]|uniref:solute carrier family 13 member 4-like n=1 Tax=Ixodes scapularis TaxID=6945 RepID=UPI001C3889CD|nr:solute carrier family 13 member 4-like [Ixodes scapularis]
MPLGMSKGSSFDVWLVTTLMDLKTVSELLLQTLLTVIAATMTEMLTSHHTVTILMPVAVQLAISRTYNPLYFAIPVTAAASSSLIFPTSGVAIALLAEMTEMGPLNLLISGLALKVLIVLSLLLSMNSLGNHFFDWSILPAWALDSTDNASSVEEA